MAEDLNLKTVETVDTRPFRKLVMTIGELPTSFIESMTYYELLAWFTNYLETVIIPTVNNNGEAVEELQDKFVDLTNETAAFEEQITALFNTLKNYVETYFDNLDVQDEINNKLDEMASDGTLQNIIYQYLQSNVTWTFDTVADMKSSTNLINGAYAQTLGFHTLNDGGGAIYKITNSGTANEMNVIAIGSTLYANLIIDSDHLNVKQFGAYGDNTHNDLTTIQACIDYGFNNKYYKIYIPEGNYIVDNAINVYEQIHLYGNVKNNTQIIKNTNSTDSDANVDAILILKKSADAVETYTQAQHINNIWFIGNDTNTYGIYCTTPSPRIEIADVAVQRTLTGIHLKSGWLYTIKDVTINPVENGIDIGTQGTSTTLNMSNTYVYGGTGIGYKLRGVTYSGLTNIACDGNSGTPYQFEYCNLSIDGFGCECPNASESIYVTQSKVDINNATIIVNPTTSSYVCVDVGTSDLLINKAVIHDFGEGTETAGKFLNCRDRGNTRFTNCTIDKKFATPNTYSQPSDSQRVSDTNGDYMIMGNATACGLGTVSQRQDDFIIKTNQDFHMGSISFNNRGSAKYSLDGFDRGYKPCHDLGDLLINQAPALNGIAIFQQTSDSRDREMAGTIVSASINGTTGTVTMTSLDLTDFSKNRGIVIETNHDIETSSGGTGTISAIDRDNNTITLSSVRGTFAANDTVTYKGKTLIRNATFANIQSIGYGTTAQRPSAPVNGYMYWDTTLGKPIWRVGNNWKDATGTNV